MNESANSKTTFRFLDAELIVRRIRPSPKISLAHNTLSKGYFERYNLTRVELKSSTLSGELCVLPKRLLFTMVKNTDFLGRQIRITFAITI